MELSELKLQLEQFSVDLRVKAMLERQNASVILLSVIGQGEIKFRLIRTVLR